MLFFLLYIYGDTLIFVPLFYYYFNVIFSHSSRISLRQDSMMLLGLSLNTSDKSHTVIWTLKNLPFDSSYLHPVPKPLGNGNTPTFDVYIVNRWCTCIWRQYFDILESG